MMSSRLYVIPSTLLGGSGNGVAARLIDAGSSGSVGRTGNVGEQAANVARSNALAANLGARLQFLERLFPLCIVLPFLRVRIINLRGPSRAPRIRFLLRRLHREFRVDRPVRLVHDPFMLEAERRQQHRDNDADAAEQVDHWSSFCWIMGSVVMNLSPTLAAMMRAP